MSFFALLPLIFFIAAYAAIAMEHTLKFNKAASALLGGVLCWTVVVLQSPDTGAASTALMQHLSDIASILFFLLGAMALVEVIDSYEGFAFITDQIQTRSLRHLLYLVAGITFFLSALLDNLTTAIVMCSLCSKLLHDKEDRLWFAGLIVIAANAGGAWSPLGDVTTTMLWISGQITAFNIMRMLFLPSLFVCLLPTLLIAHRFRGKKFIAPRVQQPGTLPRWKSQVVFFSGLVLLLFVPLFKSLTHLPPFMGMMFAMGLIWLVTTLINKRKAENLDDMNRYTVAQALQRVDTPSILFFLGILLAVSALETNGTLHVLANALDHSLQSDYLIGTALGILSAIVDNVPLVAAAQGMYPLSHFPTDHAFWEFLALTTGTGGSAIIIGSAAGVAVMGIEQIKFGWYLRRMSLLALLGFAVGIAVFLLQMQAV
ncbi:MAG: sodium:proton antiporter NhaD [Bacteroidetes bacterium]|nr:sodium:proton antiporter NhaD [Bacteroidota bacterium]